jgi:hypothetical protein
MFCEGLSKKSTAIGSNVRSRRADDHETPIVTDNMPTIFVTYL